MSEPFSLTVVGNPEPRGSKKSYVPLRRGTKEPFRRPGGGVVVNTIDDNPRSGPWMKKIAYTATHYIGQLEVEAPLTCPVELNLRFYLGRPGYHFGTGRNEGQLKAKYAGARHTVRPDRLKLARAVEDALTGILYADDAQTCTGVVEKHYCQPGSEPRVEIELVPLDVPAMPEQAALFESP